MVYKRDDEQKGHDDEEWWEIIAGAGLPNELYVSFRSSLSVGKTKRGTGREGKESIL